MSVFFIIFSLLFLDSNAILNTVNVANLYDVIVLGGGVSGLSTITALTRSGYTKTLLIEGQDRLGGRIFTTPVALANGTLSHVEYGATWVEGSSKKNPIWQIMNSLNNLDNYNFYSGYDTILAANQNGDSSQSIQNLYRKLSDALDTIYSDLTDSSSLAKQPINVSFGSLLAEKVKALISSSPYNKMDQTLVNAIVNAYLQDQLSEYSVPSFDQLSAKWIYYDEDFGSKPNNLKNGYKVLIDYLSNMLKPSQINLNETVVNINWSQADSKTNGMILVQTINSNGTITNYKAKHVVTSFSLNVLKYSTNLFTPSLPAAKLSAIKNLAMGTSNHLFFVFNQNVFNNGKTGISFLWQTAKTGFSLAADSVCNLSSNQFYKSFNTFYVPPKVPNVLFTEIVGKPSISTESVNDSCLILVMKQMLAKFYPTTKFPPIIQVIRSKWHSNPYIQGSYTYVPVGASVTTSGSTDINNLATPLNNVNKLFFVGEATSAYTGTVPGAYMSGQNAAQKLIKLLSSTG